MVQSPCDLPARTSATPQQASHSTPPTSLNRTTTTAQGLSRVRSNPGMHSHQATALTPGNQFLSSQRQAQIILLLTISHPSTSRAQPQTRHSFTNWNRTGRKSSTPYHSIEPNPGHRVPIRTPTSRTTNSWDTRTRPHNHTLNLDSLGET